MASGPDGGRGGAAAAFQAALETADMELSATEKNFQQCMRRRTEREAKKKLDGELKQAAEAKQKAAALEAAFEGQLQALLQAFDGGVQCDCADCHGTTLLSEAAAAGQLDIVQMLLAEGADANSRGRYGRTPLWRAAFCGDEAVLRELLRQGGDPRECDAEGVRPISVANGPTVRDLLAGWDTSVTDERRQQANQRRQSLVKDAERMRRERLQAQKEELDGAVAEAERRLEIGRSEVRQRKAVVHDHRHQRARLLQQGAADRLAELDQQLARAEAAREQAERITQELDWKLQRARLKRRDWESEEARKQLKSLGRMPGFRVELRLDRPDALTSLLPRLSADLELLEDLALEDGGRPAAAGVVNLKKGDVALLEGPLLEGRQSKEELMLVDLSEMNWPTSLWFNHGFDATVHVKELSDVIFKDPGGRRRSDGRWPLVVDPSGTCSKYLTYSGAAKFTVAELSQEPQPLDEAWQPDGACVNRGELRARLRKALLKNLLHGGAVAIDLEGYDFAVDSVGAPFEALERGLFGKLSDRAVLYAYLMTRRFLSLVTEELKNDFPEYAFMDENLQKFVLCFVTSRSEPDTEFARHFYTIRVRDQNQKASDEDAEKPAGMVN
eukprot:TRINITY_DN47033_c0_g1_i1.p1 TRINITY_DN47033_c0_g1~~TRINITY_DN47033_c0_g1_i1.p1  ORF type:complete len:614 (+),score=146.46 TRINITY_DN47033_c0_g1_i1:49-1890(+)